MCEVGGNSGGELRLVPMCSQTPLAANCPTVGKIKVFLKYSISVQSKRDIFTGRFTDLTVLRSSKGSGNAATETKYTNCVQIHNREFFLPATWSKHSQAFFFFLQPTLAVSGGQMIERRFHWVILICHAFFNQNLPPSFSNTIRV